MELKKIVFTGREKVELLSVPIDQTPLSTNEVAGPTLYTLISPGTELNMYLGNYAQRGLGWGQFPCYPGYASVFRAEQTGSGVDDIHQGDLVYCMGKHQSYQRLERNECIPVPKGMEAELVPFCRIMNVTMSTLTDTISRPPAKVLVTGLGIVGLMGAQIFARCGYEVIAVDPMVSRRMDAENAGLRTVLAAIPLDDPKYAGKIALHLECASAEQAVLDGCKMVKKGGEIVLVGTQMVRNSELTAEELLYWVFRNNVILKGGSEWRISRFDTDFRQNSNFLNMETGLKWLHEGSVRVDGIYSLVSPQEPQNIYQQVKERQTPKLGTLFDWTAI
jgi:threonine dehydrogenase-like Zn-dependent dehydrogenase